MNKATTNALKHFRLNLERKVSKADMKACQDKIKNSDRPLATAKALLNKLADDFKNSYKTKGKRRYDMSDVQEVEVQAIRKFHWLEPLQNKWLGEMNYLAARNKLTSNVYAGYCLKILDFEPTLPLAYRKRERQYEVEYG